MIAFSVSKRFIRFAVGAGALCALATVAAQPARAQVQVLAPGVAIATFDTAWSRVDATYYDTLFLSTRWRELRDSLRPMAEATTSNAELRRIIQVMLSGIGTSHFGLIPREASPVLSALDGSERASSRPTGIATGDAGASVRIAGEEMIVWTVVQGGPAELAGLRPGDRVRAIGSVEFEDAVRQLKAIDAESIRRQTSLTLAMRANSMLTGAAGDPIDFLVVRGGAEHTVSVPRRPLPGSMTRLGNLPPMHANAVFDEHIVSVPGGSRRVGAIAFTIWLPAVFPRIDSAVHRFRDADGLIIDLRGNPGGLAALTGRLAGHVLDTAVSLGALHMRTTTLNLVANPQRVAPDGETRVHPFAGPVAIIIDPLSASASEFFAAGLQGLGRARVFGDTSAGASVPALMGRLPNGDVMLHAIADHLDPLGRRIEGRGVIPDEQFELDPAAVAAGRDVPMEAAIQWILTQPQRSQAQ